jgi:hypothetical protein
VWVKILAAGLAVAMTTGSVSAQTDPYTGTWLLNLARSGGDSRTQTLTIEIQGEQESYRSELVWPNGRRQVTTYVAKYDGKEYPSRTIIQEDADERGTPRDDTVILEKIDERTRERIWKQDGRIVRILRRVVSPDGRTLTSQVVDVDQHGVETVASTLVFDKQ